jgi:hypothetical protein
MPMSCRELITRERQMLTQAGHLGIARGEAAGVLTYATG